MSQRQEKNGEHLPRPPRLVLGGLYSTDDVVTNLRISPNTLTEWKRGGLHAFQAKGDYFLADDILNYLRNRSSDT